MPLSTRLIDCCFCRQVSPLDKDCVALMFTKENDCYSHSCHGNCLYQSIPSLKEKEIGKFKSGDDYVEDVKSKLTEAAQGTSLCCYCKSVVKGKNCYVLHCFLSRKRKIVDVIHCACVREIIKW